MATNTTLKALRLLVDGESTWFFHRPEYNDCDLSNVDEVRVKEFIKQMCWKVEWKNPAVSGKGITKQATWHLTGIGIDNPYSVSFPTDAALYVAVYYTFYNRLNIDPKSKVVRTFKDEEEAYLFALYTTFDLTVTGPWSMVPLRKKDDPYIEIDTGGIDTDPVLMYPRWISPRPFDREDLQSLQILGEIGYWVAGTSEPKPRYFITKKCWKAFHDKFALTDQNDKVLYFDSPAHVARSFKPLIKQFYDTSRMKMKDSK